MRTVLLSIFAVSALAASSASSQQPAEVAIRAAVQKYVAAFNSADAEAAAATYAPDGSHTYAAGFTHHGRVEIARGLRDLLAGPMRGARISIASLNIRFLTPTIALEEESFSVQGLKSPNGDPLPAVNGLCLVVHQQHDQQWLAAAVQCMVPPPNQGQQ